MRDIDWNLLKSFVFVCKTGSLSGAARALRSTQPTIGRHIEALEEKLGVSLFVRSREGLAPTETALELLPEASAMNDRFQSLTRLASGEAREVSGVVRIAASEIMGVEVLPTIIGKFREAYPEIQIELVLSNQNQDLLKREADIAVRMADPTQTALIAKRIGETEIGLYAHRKYLEKHAKILKKSQIEGHVFIGPDTDPQIYALLKRLEVLEGREQTSIRVDNQLAQLAFVRKGAGICGMQVRIAERDRNLIRILADEFHFGLPVWVLMHEDLRSVKRIRLLYQHLTRELSAFLKPKGR